MTDLEQSKTIFNLAPTPELKRDLLQIDRLIAALYVMSMTDPTELGDMDWLQRRRGFLLATLASREAQRRQKIVSLDMWRSGGRAAAKAFLDVA